MRPVKTKKRIKRANASYSSRLGHFLSNLFVYKQANRRDRTTTTVVRKSVLYQGAAVCGVASLLMATWYEVPQKIYEATTTTMLKATAQAGLRVEEVLINGRHFAPTDKILAAVQLTTHDPIFKRSVVEIQKNLEEISWIKSAQVQRRLPGTLYIKIVERQPIALWQHQKVHYLVDAEGVIISNGNVQHFANLPVVVGGDAPLHAPKMLALLEKFPFVKEHVTAIVRVGSRRWNVQLDRNTEVKLPEAKAEEALARLNLLLEQKKIDTSEVKTVDLRLQNKMIVSLTPSTEVKLKGKGKPV